MNRNKPENIDEYKKWLKEKHQVDINQSQTHYNSVTARLKLDFENSSFWIQINKNHLFYVDTEKRQT